ncbi:conjugal transfer pilus assembly protein TraE [Citrobacter freundii]|nr:conjugal transfer pilus assembly protein TraE [Citrobacter freundii]
MEISARNSSTKIIAVIILSLTTLVFILGFAWHGCCDQQSTHPRATYSRHSDDLQRAFVVSERKPIPSIFRMMTLSFLALRLNVAPETSIPTTPF